MTRVIRTGVVLAMLASALAVPSAASATPATGALNAVNFVRARHHMRALRFSRTLQRSARRYARHLMHSGYFGHASRIHASRRFHMLGECLELHRGRPSVRRAVLDWLHSPAHRAILLSRRFRFAGVGLATGRFHGHRSTIWVMHFGRR